MDINRKGGRAADEMREIKITRNFIKYALGSCLIEIGDTKVVCAVNVEEKVPHFLRDTGSGWITAEYAMLPASTSQRTGRNSNLTGRSQEIQRLIGRCLRGIVDMHKLGERTIWVDCDVLQADGGTRTASVTGAFIALVDGLNNMQKRTIRLPIIKDYLGAISVGIVRGSLLADLDYSEDSMASTDINVVMNGSGEFIEIQGAAEGCSFSKKELDELVELASVNINKIIEKEREVLGNDTQFLLGN